MVPRARRNKNGSCDTGKLSDSRQDVSKLPRAVQPGNSPTSHFPEAWHRSARRLVGASARLGARRLRRFNARTASGPGIPRAVRRRTLKRAKARAPSPDCASIHNPLRPSCVLRLVAATQPRSLPLTSDSQSSAASKLVRQSSAIQPSPLQTPPPSRCSPPGPRAFAARARFSCPRMA